MIKSAEIKGFRCFKSAHLPDCRRVNVIVGDNAGGKTSLLEALVLGAGGGSEIPNKLRAFRGFPEGMTGELQEVADAIWLDLFYGLDRRRTITIQLHGSQFRNRQLEVSFVETPSKSSDLAGRKVDSSSGFVPIRFKWTGPPGHNTTVKPEIKDGKLIVQSVLPLPEDTYFFPSGLQASSSETSKRFSALSKAGRLGEIVDVVRASFPAIKDLSLEVIAGNTFVCAAVDGVPERIPLNVLSSGIAKLCSLYFALASKRGSVAMIDEVENGVYFDRLPTMWENILAFCERFDAQVFVSTHSLECLQAAGRVAQRNAESFSLIQVATDREVRQFAGERFALAMEQQVEVR